MIRLRRDDFEDPHELAKFAATCGIHLQQFRDEFEYLIQDEAPPSVSHQKRLAILVGGGPAPGINSVIGAATIRGVLEGVEVLGIRDGFEWIMQGNVDRCAR